MDIYLQNFLISITISIPFLIGLIRYARMDERFRPFVWICGTITLNELVMYGLLLSHHYTFASYNLVLLVLTILYLILFKRWGLFNRYKNLWIIIFSVMMVVWIADHFLIHGYMLEARTHYFRVCYSLMLVLLSVVIINRMIVSEKKSLISNSQFLICISLVIYYTYRIIVDAFTIKGMSEHFLTSLGDFNRYLLVTIYLVFALAALWIPTKKNYTIQF